MLRIFGSIVLSNQNTDFRCFLFVCLIDCWSVTSLHYFLRKKMESRLSNRLCGTIDWIFDCSYFDNNIFPCLLLKR